MNKHKLVDIGVGTFIGVTLGTLIVAYPINCAIYYFIERKMQNKTYQNMEQPCRGSRG